MKISIYAGEPIERAFALDEGLTRSGRLNAIVAAYLDIMADQIASVPLTRAEWCAIFDARNGEGIGRGVSGAEDGQTWRFAWANIADSPELDAKWGIDHKALASRMQAMPIAVRIAIMEACGRFWQHCDLPTDEALTKAGIR